MKAEGRRKKEEGEPPHGETCTFHPSSFILHPSIRIKSCVIVTD
jgi:hypothetical protein